MHTETLLINSMQQQHYMSHLNHDHLIPDQQQNQQQLFTHLPSTAASITTTNTSHTSLSTEGLYNPTTTAPQQHLTSECPSQYYITDTTTVTASTAATSRLNDSNTTCSSSSSLSSSSSSTTSNDSSNNYTCPNATAKNNNVSIGVNLRVTGQCSQGGRKYMEDYFSVAYQQSENAKDLEYAFIGIYDGHGGAEAAKFAKEHLMMKIINQRLFWSDNDHDVLRAIREGYIATHYAMWREQDKWPKTANGLPSTAGTTATVAFIRREKIYIGHVGDSGIVLGYQNENENFWRAKQLTTDHKPESVEERTRIMNSGGKVVVKSGVPRVVWNRPRNASHRGPIRKKTLIDEIPFLAVARSLGDLWSYNSERNEFVVSPDPDVKVIPINPKTFRCLIFGTDGLWNVVNAQEAVNTVRDNEVINERLMAQRGDGPQEGNQWTNPSKSLVAQALRTWSNKKMRADNTSVVTVMLYPPGQSDHNGTDETVCKVANPPEFVQPVSYGLEYSQVEAEVTEYDNATTYKEMALKYLPPEAYRNFDYYADDSDTEEEDNDEEESEEEEHEVITNKSIKPVAGDLQQNSNYSVNFEQTNVWNWQNNNSNNHNLATLNRQNDEEDEEEEDLDEEEDEEDEEEEEEVEDQTTVLTNERQHCIVNYQNYVHLEAEETNNATDSYINTFAESYNSILTANQDVELKATSSSSSSPSSSSNSNSNSNSYCQSVSQFELELEQQLYQQQCMSEEEGYSLTKLETRREQQTCKTLEHRTETTSAVQTFKIFPETANQTQHIEVYHQQQNSESYYGESQQFITHMAEKPLELHSLLQQEREEEQQVAYERLQMEQHQNIAAYACLQPTTTTQSVTAEIATNSLEDTITEEVEYLEEEIDDEEDEEVDAIVEADSSVQINEISSSSCGEESALQDEEVVLETIEKIEILPHNPKETEDNSLSKEPEVLKNPKYHNTPSKISKNNSICLETKQQTSAATTLAITTPLKANLSHSTKRGRACNTSSYLYANENLQRISNTKNQHSLYGQTSKRTTNAMVSNTPAEKRRRSICMTPGINMTPPAATSTPMYQRQLRSTTTSSSCTPNASSTTPLMDYGKRTLRTRNSLAKDLKAKSALKFSHNAVTRNFLRTTAANLMSGKPLLINEQHLTPCSRRTLNGAAHSSRSNNRSAIKTRREKPGVTINGSLNQNKSTIQHPLHLNLRSRQANTTNTSVSSPNTSNLNSLRSPPPPSPVAASTPVIKRASLTERRILRSMHTRSSSSKGSQIPANFSKSTRTQSTGSNLAAPPPSPKLINAAAAVAAATRARSLLNAKHAAAANGSQSVVAAVFGKRTSLRSNGSSHPAVLPPVTKIPSNATSSPSTAAATTTATPASTHQTLRGRIVKKR
ncbi:protein phosphatase 2C [Cochliomyia hominivorax]